MQIFEPQKIGKSRIFPIFWGSIFDRFPKPTRDFEQKTIKRTLPSTSEERVNKDLATRGVKIEIYTSIGNKKIYTIGSTTYNHLGNYMLLNGSKNPQVVHIPFFNGFLSPRYGIQGNTLNINDWRSNLVFNFSFEDISRLNILIILMIIILIF